MPAPLGPPLSPPLEEPIRAELFGVERLEQHAASLAAAQPVRRDRGWARPLLARVRDNATALRDAYRSLTAAARAGRPIAPAAEWVIENFHVIDEQLREIRDDLPAGFYRELPKLGDGPLRGHPRVYGIAWAFVAHTDSRFEPEMLRRFVRAYQRVDVLTIGELWAIAITLRIVLVENLRRLAVATVSRRAARDAADGVADDLLGVGLRSPDGAVAALERGDSGPLTAPFAVRLIERLRDQDPGATPGLAWLHRELAAMQTDADTMVQAELQWQAATTVTARNVITSMRLMSALDWAEFFESVSLVDEILRSETAFDAMDFASRDRYRHAIEQLARRSGVDELDVTRRVVAAARARPENGMPVVEVARRADPGYHLLGEGRRAFERAIGFRPRPGRRLLRAYLRLAAPGYLGTIFVVAAAILAVPFLMARASGASPGTLIVLAILGAFPAADLAIALVNRTVTAIAPPRVLVRLELKTGAPAELRTLVAVPTLLTSPADIDRQIDRLEEHYLANPDGHLHFALLTDWTDAPTQSTDDDPLTLSRVVDGVARLNQSYGPLPDGYHRFFVLHRERRWNGAERRWMGWERKRGKLRELNRLLRGAGDTSFNTPDGTAPAVPPDVRFVIALDADTRMPIGAVNQLVGTIAHPLNRPGFDTRRGRVIAGYGVLQPRITPPLPVGATSLLQQLSSGPGGIDPYAAAVSDVYQDLFGEGSYTGKGLYDVDAFEQALDDRIPENALLSHDLFEGIFARTALVSDIELFEEAPSHYLVAAARQHRWARGDWQLLPWLLRFSMPVVSRWKMCDNLRRALSPPALTLTLLAAWVLPATEPTWWTALVLAALGTPAFLPFFGGLVPRARGGAKRSHVRAVAGDFRRSASQLALSVIMLAHQACLMVDAIVRTLVRMFITHRHRLEWVTAAEVESGSRLDVRRFIRSMAGAMAVALGTVVLIASFRPGSWPLALTFVVLWAVSPLVAHGVSVPTTIQDATPLGAGDARALRLIARRTWRFFETHVGAEDRWLPPDNFQEAPSPVVAHRTSPTNIGLYLLSAMAANDFGWIGALDTVDRIEATLDSVEELERLQGHWYNWYDTRDGHPLEPRYLSSVDSGNLAGALLTLAGAGQELLDRPLCTESAVAGPSDAARIIRSIESGTRSPIATDTRRKFHGALRTLIVPGRHPGNELQRWLGRLDAIAAETRQVRTLGWEIAGRETDAASTEMLQWIANLERDVSSQRRDADTLLPWAAAVAALVPDAHVPSLRRLPVECANWRDTLSARQAGASGLSPGESADIAAVLAALESASTAGQALIQRVQAIIDRARELVSAMNFRVLFDPVRKLFSIGYRVSDNRLDSGQYDLLASEARLTSFVAIAKGDVPVSHWFHLGRALTPVGRSSVLVSWSGSMFEYLMPSIVMQVPEGSLLDQTCRQVVRRQIAYGDERGVPWGISESGYNGRDLAMTYQYSSFGVPGLGLRRQANEDLVIAPYATALAALVDPVAAARNFDRLAENGALGPFGYYEALDFTPTRIPVGARVAVVRSYMSHHQGMVLLSIGEALLDNPMRRRFHSEPIVRASELLLQERTPRDVPVARPEIEEVPFIRDVREPAAPVARRFLSPHGALPRVQLLANTQSAVMVTASGGGYSRWRDLAVTRWREDATCDGFGSWIYLRDRADGTTWSAAYQPAGVEPDEYSVAFSEDRVEFVRRDGSIETRLEVFVSPEDDAEVRRLTLRNLGRRTREIDVTSYAEVVLAPQGADVAHPAFSDLFVRTEMVPEQDLLLATRRRRAANESEAWLAHIMLTDDAAIGTLEWETDRARFLGRGRDARRPEAVISGLPLSNTVGSVLHPVVALRRRIRLRPGGHALLVCVTMVAASRERVLEMASKYRIEGSADRVADLAWTQAQAQLHHLGVAADEAHVFQALAGALLYTDRTLRPSPDALARPHGGQQSLWAHGISGDLPIVVVQVDEVDDLPLVRQLLRAHEYWRLKHLAVDLVIVNEHGHSYLQDLQNQLETLVRASRPAAAAEGQPQRGAVFALRADRLPPPDRGALMNAARVVLSGRRGTLSEQLLRAHRTLGVGQAPVRPARASPAQASRPAIELEHFNGLGGFGAAGSEYVVVLTGEDRTPAPWINVISNAEFGFHVSESGAGYTWSINSHENQLTPWSNDPVSDPPSEVFYLRDEDSGEVWTPTALPIRDAGSYIARHGAGFSRFEHDAQGIGAELLQFVPLQDPIKISRITLTNRGNRPRRISITAYLEWVLGTNRGAAAPGVVTERDPDTGVMFARNGWNTDFRERVAFATLGQGPGAFTADRTEFLGRNGSLEYPAALARRTPLSGRAGAGFDPCCAMQASYQIPPRGSIAVVFLLGQASDRGAALTLAQKYRVVDVERAVKQVAEYWDAVLGTLQVDTPDRTLDLMLNRWLLYQTLACRILARSAFYQASGAYGFRDQLQDVMALAVASPATTRTHLLRAAARQFTEGDVQHWWHPTTGRGLRTRMSDDLLWLPYVVSHYLDASGDDGILDATIPFLEGARLGPGELECYFQPRVSDQVGTLFEHCARAMDRSLALGKHGLPLIGTGDWNDGMNRVGFGGEGESVWLAWFLRAVLTEWAPIACRRGERERADRWRAHAASLAESLDREGWDGEWYRRAYFDDGTPLGSHSNDECRIDAIAQSWSVLAGGGDPARARQAMASLERHLVRQEDRIQLLLTPPFDRTALDPGYIKGYLPGIRENGGQYTHAAVWTVAAYAMLGDGDRAGDIFSLLNPLNHARTASEVARYKTEPYVVAGDVYSEPPHAGRGGWTWYTGAAGWLYRAGIEYLLGFRLRGRELEISPCIPRKWPRFGIVFRYHSARYDISVENPNGVSTGIASIQVDGVALPVGARVPLENDGQVHQVRIVLGATA